MKATVGLLMLAILPVALMISEHRSQRERLTALHAELETLRAQQAKVMRRALTVTPVLTPRASDPPPIAAAPLAPSREPPADAAPDEAASWEEQARASQAAVEQAFEGEEASGAWAVTARAELQQQAAAIARVAGSSVGEVQCRASMCRLEIRHRDLDAARQFSDLAFAAATGRIWNGPVMITARPAQPDGSVAAVLYLGRDGTQLLARAP